MRNKVLFRLSLAVMIAALLCMCLNWLVISLPDWAVRTTGIVMLLNAPVLSYSSVRMMYGNDAHK